MIFTLLFILPVIALATQLGFNKSTTSQYAKVAQIIYSVLFLLLSIYIFIYQHKLTVFHIASWPAPYGIVLVVDQLTRLLLLVFAVIITCISLFSLTDNTLNKSHATFYTSTWLLMLGVTGSLTTYDIFNLYVWSEVILVSAFIALGVYKKDNSKNISRYAIFNITGTLFILLSIAMLYGLTGHLNDAAIAQTLMKLHSNLTEPAIALLILGLAIKGGVFPFYFWLPSNYPNTSASSTLLLSSLVTKIIMIVILRLFWLWQPITSTLLIPFVLLACCTMFFGVMGAANEFRLRNILSFHIISQIGYVLLAIFIPSTLAIIAMLFFLIHNILVKTNLLMTSSIIEAHYNTSHLNKLGGILKVSPLLGTIFFLSAMSLAGFPPLSGFWGKLLIFQATYKNHLYIALAFAIAVSLFTLYSMIKIWRYAYCENNLTEESYKSFRPSNIQLAALLPLTILPLLLGLSPNTILPTLQSIANQLSHPHIIMNAISGAKT